MQSVSVVLPIYNNGASLRELYERLVKTLESLAPVFELLMVEDGGGDNSWQIVEELALKDPRVKAVRLSRNFGQHPATAAGLDHARGDVIVLMDADLQDRPEEIPNLVRELGGEIDAVYTVKGTVTESLWTRLSSRLFHYAFSQITGRPVPKDIGTFRAFTRRVLDALKRYPEKRVLFGPLMFFVGFKSTTITVQRDERPHGRSSYTFRKRLALAIDALISYSDLPHRVMVNFGGLTILGTILYAVALVVRWVLDRASIPPGLTLLLMFMTMSLGIIMVGLGILGSYIYRIYQEVLNRPRYVIARTVNLDEDEAPRAAASANFREAQPHGGATP